MGADEMVDHTAESAPGRVNARKPNVTVDCILGETKCLEIAKRYVTIVGDKTARTTIG
jgi:reticulon-4-interacting protein 1, mitochondrial